MHPDIISAWIEDLLSSPKRKHSIAVRSSSTERPHKQHRYVLDSISRNAERKTLPPHEKRPMSRRVPSPTKKSARLLQRRTEEQQQTPLGEEVEGYLPATPRQPNYQAALRIAASTFPPSQNPEISSIPRTNSSRASQSRSSSPVKNVNALRDIGACYLPLGEDLDALGDEGKVLCEQLKDCGDAEEIFPAAVSELIKERVKGIRIKPSNLDHRDNRPQQLLLAELDSIRAIVAKSHRCVRENEYEAEWNNAVHGPMLYLVFDEQEQVGFRYIPNVAITREYLPTDLYGLPVNSRIIDYAIFTSLQGDVYDSSKGFLFPSAQTIVSINHISYTPLRHRPIAISIETKTISRSEEEARVQLAIWITSQITRLRSLLPPNMSDQQTAIWNRLILPLIFVQSDKWSVYFARPLSTGAVNIHADIAIGGTGSERSAYSLLKALRVLRNWADNWYGSWLSDLLAPV